MRYNRKNRREKDFIICPRCGLKSLSIAEECPECGLVFSRLNIATNKDAKRKILRGDRDFIIKTSKLPSDVSRIKLLLLSIFTGLFGGHCFYVGRYWRGSILLLNALSLILYVVFNDQLLAIDEGRLLAALSTIGGLIMFIWLFDIVWIIMKKFKVPIAIDLEADIVKNEEDIMDVEEWRNLGEEKVEDPTLNQEKMQPKRNNKKQEEIKQDEDSSRN